MRLRPQRRAILKLGGCCACCGLGLGFLPALTLHHVHETGWEHYRKAAGVW